MLACSRWGAYFSIQMENFHLNCGTVDRYFNEPSYEQTMATADGQARAAAYNQIIRRATVAHAILEPLKSPPPFFEEVATAHFQHVRARVLTEVGQWCREDRDTSSRGLGKTQMTQLAKLLPVAAPSQSAATTAAVK